MAALTFIGDKLAGDLLAPGQLLYLALEFRAVHTKAFKLKKLDLDFFEPE